MAIFQPQIVGKGGETYIAGKGINIDEESKEISVVDPVLVNESTIEGVVQIGDYELLDSNGTIPEDRLANTTSAIQGQILTLDINKNAIWADPDALPASTKYGANLVLSIDSSTYVVTAQLKDQDGNNLGSSQTIDLPLESVVVSGRYDDSTKKVILTLQSGSTVEFSIADLIDGLQNQMQFSNMPEATIENLGRVIQYVGVTDANYTNGYFYKCISDGQSTPTYSWKNVEVQPAGDSLPDQTGQAGKFLTTDGTDASWSNKPLVNKATGESCLSILGGVTTGYRNINIGIDTKASGSDNTALGVQSEAYGDGSIAIGYVTKVKNVGIYGTGVAIGRVATVSATGAIQLSASQNSATNSDTNTFKVANNRGNFEMMSADGTIPEDRLASTASATAGQVLTLDANKNAVWANSGGGGGGDYVPQYSELPEATIDNVYTVAQYVGETDGVYTNGYFYKNNDSEEPTYAEASGDPCYGEITVDVDTFEPIVNLSDGEETTFTWVVEHPWLDYSIIQGYDFSIDVWDPEIAGADYSYFIETIAGEYDESYDNTYYVYIGNDEWNCFKDDDTNFGTATTGDFGSISMEIMPYEEDFQEGDKFSLSKSGDFVDRWERDGVPLEDEGYYSPLDYGISWTGYDEENTSITVVYHEGQIIYEWQRVDVQPQPVINYPVTSVNNQTGAVNITAAGIGATTKITRTATLYSNAWTEGSNHNKQTISVSGVTSNNIVLVAPNSTDEGVSQAIWSKSGVLCVAQSNNSLTFMYDSTKSAPNTNIDVNIVILN